MLAKAESTSAVLLYIASGVPLRGKRIEDAGYLFYVARFRVEFDKAMFPPTGTGGDSPPVLFGALQQQLGSAVNPALMSDPKAFAKVLAKVKAWTPEIPPAYNPGWEFSEKRAREQADEALHGKRTQFEEGMNGICALLQDAAYFATFRIAQDYNLKFGDGRPSKEAFDQAMATMKKIEHEKGIQGIASKTK